MSTLNTEIPLDNPERNLMLAQPDRLPHIGLVGDTYTIFYSGHYSEARAQESA